MSSIVEHEVPVSPGLAKAPTGIQGLDEITGGGLPRKPTYSCLRKCRLLQDAIGDGIFGTRSHAVRRTGRIHVF